MPDDAAAFLNIAIVGTGPTGLYTLHHLLQAQRPLTVTLIEAGALAGVGSPYHPESTSLSMLANIASIEIPPLQDSYMDWLRRQPEAILQVYGVDPDMLHERQFLPRLLLGAWFRDNLEGMVAAARALGHQIAVREGTQVTDVAPVQGGIRLSFITGSEAESLIFSHVVLATGHVWPDVPASDPQMFVSPWTGLIEANVPATQVGVLGTSLSAIDAAMAVASQHGRFASDGETGFTVSAGSEALRITLMSRQGLLPEADFWCPLPYQPLTHFTEAALMRARDAGAEGLLDRLWRLFASEMTAADPAYAAAIGIAHLSPEGFAKAYFAPRLTVDPFVWAEANLAQVDRNAKAQRTVGWRYAILRMHEPMETMVPHLVETDRARFEVLKRVFVDNYAAVPPQSIRRLLALHRAGILTVLRLGEGYRLEHKDGVTQIRCQDGREPRFEVFVDARGQRALGVADLPFPSLRRLLGEKDAPILLTDSFAVTGVDGERLFLPAAPYLLHRMPFAQGITASHDMGAAVAAALLNQMAATPL
jgi:uncharacterized NAD(P)/FAD-binding protein YdhS